VIEAHFKDVKNFKEFIWPFAVAIFAVGGMGGAFIGPFIAKAIGRYLILIFLQKVIYFKDCSIFSIVILIFFHL